jgi:hypothetical protein
MTKRRLVQGESSSLRRKEWRRRAHCCCCCFQLVAGWLVDKFLIFVHSTPAFLFFPLFCSFRSHRYIDRCDRPFFKKMLLLWIPLTSFFFHVLGNHATMRTGIMEIESCSTL